MLQYRPMTSIPKRNPFANPVYRTGRHCTFKMHVHLVFVTKYRKTLFQKKHFDTMKNLLKKYVLTLNQPLWSSTVNMTMFIFLSISHRKISIAKLVNSLKEYLPESLSISIQIFFLLSSTLLFGLLVTLLLLVVALLSPSLLSTSKISALLL